MPNHHTSLSFQQAYHAQQQKLRHTKSRPSAQTQKKPHQQPSQPNARHAHLAIGSPSQQKGAYYEARAAQYLQQQGLKILARQLRYPYGEIDILAWSDPYLIVVEVRFRAAQHYGGASHSIGPQKKERLRRAGLHAYKTYRRLLRRNQLHLRFDVVLCDHQQLTWLPNAITYQ